MHPVKHNNNYTNRTHKIFNSNITKNQKFLIIAITTILLQLPHHHYHHQLTTQIVSNNITTATINYHITAIMAICPATTIPQPINCHHHQPHHLQRQQHHNNSQRLAKLLSQYPLNLSHQCVQLNYQQVGYEKDLVCKISFY